MTMEVSITTRTTADDDEGDEEGDGDDCLNQAKGM